MTTSGVQLALRFLVSLQRLGPPGRALSRPDTVARLAERIGILTEGEKAAVQAIESEAQSEASAVIEGSTVA
jgi:hypothetical protein